MSPGSSTPLETGDGGLAASSLPSTGHSSDRDVSEKETSDTERKEDNNDDLAMSGIPLYMFSIGVMTVVFLMTLDHYILATAIPRITTDFESLADAAWYSSGYYLTNMAFQPALGQMYNLFSVKRVYLTSLTIFEAGSILCALAPTSSALIAGRLITGVGGGGLYIGSVVLVGYAVPKQYRAIYISIITSLDGVASAVGPPLGGVFTESHLTWRFCFWINLPIGFIAFVLLYIYLRDPPLVSQARTGLVFRRFGRVDWLGLALLLGGSVMLLLALQWAGLVYAWTNPRVYACLTVGAIVLVLYLVQQYRLGESAAFNLFINVLIGAFVYYLPFQFQASRNESPRQAGITHLAFLIPLMLSPLVSGTLISLSGYYVPFMYLGGTLATVGAGLLTTLKGSTPPSALYGFQFLAGFGAGLCHQIPYTSILHVTAAKDLVAGSALCSFLNSVGAILGIVGSQAIFANLLLRGLSETMISDSATVIRAGPSHIMEVVPAAEVGLVRRAYNDALQSTFLLPVIAAGLCCMCTLGVEWKRQKK